MSQFKTLLPLDVAKILALIPEGSHVQNVKLSVAKEGNPLTATGVEVHWENDRLNTGFTFATEFPAENLEEGADLPEGVKVADPNRHQQRVVTPRVAAGVAPKRVQSPEAKAFHAAQALARAKAAGKPAPGADPNGNPPSAAAPEVAPKVKPKKSTAAK